MNPKDKKNPYGLENATDVPAAHEDYSLEEILAEFGGSLEQTLLRGTETTEEESPSQPPPDPVPPPPQPVSSMARPMPPEKAPPAPAPPPPPEATPPPAEEPA